MTANSWQHSHALRRAEWPGQYSKNTMMVVESLGKPRWWRREIIRIISNPETSCNLSNQCLSSMVPLRKKGYSHPREPVLWTNMEECIKMPPKVDCSIHGDSMYLRSPYKEAAQSEQGKKGIHGRGWSSMSWQRLSGKRKDPCEGRVINAMGDWLQIKISKIGRFLTAWKRYRNGKN